MRKLVSLVFSAVTICGLIGCGGGTGSDARPVVSGSLQKSDEPLPKAEVDQSAAGKVEEQSPANAPAASGVIE
jgi:hypothetical protein